MLNEQKVSVIRDYEEKFERVKRIIQQKEEALSEERA